MKWPLWARRLRHVFWEDAPAPRRRDQFTAGSISPMWQRWATQPLSADRELENDFMRLRARSREQTRNNNYAKRFRQLVQSHISGPNGVQCRPRNRFGSGKLYDTVNDAVLAAWLDWGKPRYASANGRLSWRALQRLALAEWVASGEALFLLHLDKGNPYGLTLQPIDCDRLDDRLTIERDATRGINEIRFGVELNRFGKPLAYHVLRKHPNDLRTLVERANNRDRIPAEQIIHLYTDDERVERTRGVSPLCVAMRDLRHVDGFQDAALVQARTAAAAMGFIVTESPEGDVTDPDEGMEFQAEPATIRELGMGQKFQSWDPDQPNDSYAGFVKAVLRAIAAGLGVSYATLANDNSDANYSSMRVGRAEEQETWQVLQGWFIESFCQPVFDAWLETAVLAGGLQIPGSDITKARVVEWQPRRWQSVDPVKDIEADERRVALGVSNRQDIITRDGGDFYDNLEKLREEQDEAERLQLNITPAKAGGVGNAKQQKGTDDDTADGSLADGDEGNDRGDRPRSRGTQGGGRSTNPALAIV